MWGRYVNRKCLASDTALQRQLNANAKKEREKTIYNWMAAREAHDDERPGVEGVAGRKLSTCNCWLG